MKLLEKIKEKRLAVKSSDEREVVVSVPDIKEYLVREYNRVNDLKLINEGLEQQLEEAKQTKLDYDAALVTLDEYSKRLVLSEKETQKWKDEAGKVREDLKSAKDEINSYKIKFTNAAITKAEITAEIVEELKADLIAEINNHKGNLSKKTVCDIITACHKG